MQEKGFWTRANLRFKLSKNRKDKPNPILWTNARQNFNFLDLTVLSAWGAIFFDSHFLLWTYVYCWNHYWYAASSCFRLPIWWTLYNMFHNFCFGSLGHAEACARSGAPFYRPVGCGGPNLKIASFSYHRLIGTSAVVMSYWQQNSTE